jgi:hypothetical protein
MRHPESSDDLAAAQTLLASVRKWAASSGLAASYQHDHDKELARYWYADPSGATPTVSGAGPEAEASSAFRPTPRRRDGAYWDETADLVLDYFELLAGSRDSEALFEGFIEWLKRSPARRKQYEEGNDMNRAALVDWYLKLVR